MTQQNIDPDIIEAVRKLREANAPRPIAAPEEPAGTVEQIDPDIREAVRATGAVGRRERTDTALARAGYAPPESGIPPFMPGVTPKRQLTPAEHLVPKGGFTAGLGVVGAPLNVFAETGVELGAQVPKLARGRFDELEAPTVVRRGYGDPLGGEANRQFLDRPLYEQLPMSLIDPFAAGGLVGLGRGGLRGVRGLLTAGGRAGEREATELRRLAQRVPLKVADRPALLSGPLSAGDAEAIAAARGLGPLPRGLAPTPEDLTAIGEARAAWIARHPERTEIMNTEPLTMPGAPPLPKPGPGVAEAVALEGPPMGRPPAPPGGTGGSPPVGGPAAASGDPISRVLEALKTSKSLRSKLEPERAAERTSRAAEMERIFSATPGTAEERAMAARAGARGPLPNKAFEPIGGQIQPPDREALYSAVTNFDGFGPYERTLRGPDALRKLLDTGELLQPNEIDLLEEVFPTLGASLRKRQENVWQKALRLSVDVVNIPKVLKSTADFSGVLRQGFLLLSEVKQVRAALRDMLRSGFDEREFIKFNAAQRKSRFYHQAREDGIQLTNTGSALGQREEAYASQFVQSKFQPRQAAGTLERGAVATANVAAWPVRTLTRASERAYVGFLNSIRLGVYENYARLWEVLPSDPVRYAAYRREMKELARVVNVFSGRGYLGAGKKAALEQAAPALNLFLFSPRQVAARFEAPLMPVHALTQGSPRVARMAARNLVASFGATASLMAVIKASGAADVETNPNSPDFGKARVGNTRVDFFAGFQQVARLISQMQSERQKTQDGRIVAKRRWEIGEQFGLNKASPSAGFVIGWMKEPATEKPTERESSSFYPTDAVGRLRSLFAPMFFDDLWDAVEEEGLVGAALAAPAFFGAGLTTYAPPKRRRNLWSGPSR